MHKVAVIDLGTNTFNLLIASKNGEKIEIIHSEKIGVALGMGGINDNIITPDAFHRGIEALADFKSKCTNYKVDKIVAIGTSALRDAKNSQDFCDLARKKTGIIIEIISGLREANLIYKGVKMAYAFSKPAIIMDIGGGSTEFILADANGILAAKSFDIGVSRIYQELKLKDPFTETEITRVKNWLAEKTDNYFQSFQCETLIGASGSFETFHEMIHQKNFVASFSSLEFPMPNLKTIIDWIIFSTQEERDNHPFIIPIRRKMAPIAAVKTQWIMENLGISQTFVTPCSLKEGVLFEELFG